AIMLMICIRMYRRVVCHHAVGRAFARANICFAICHYRGICAMQQPDHLIRRDELPVTSQPGLRLARPDDDRLFYGRVGWLQLRDGLSLHWSDYEELQDFVTENVVGPRLSFVLFLDGQSEVSYGDLPLTF